MVPERKYAKQPPSFWAHIKMLSEYLGYSKNGSLKRYTLNEVLDCLRKQKLKTDHLFTNSKPTELGELVVGYLNHRSELIENGIRKNLMDKAMARAEFEKLQKSFKGTCALPMNKQKGEKRHHAYMTCIVNMLTATALDGETFDDEPRGLITVTRDGSTLRTLSRWMDGAYPAIQNPSAIWEIKEYYGTTTFGSRVADGVYETMLDGFELQELAEHERTKILHYLIVDDRFTWWDCGKSYLCRIVDMLHMGLVDEVLFGKEVLTRWPEIVRSWGKSRTARAGSD